MASLSQHHSNCDRLFSANIRHETRRRTRGSTSQMCLQKILTVITTVPPPLAAASSLFPSSETRESLAGLGLDLNIGFCVSPEPFEAGASTNAAAGEGGGDRLETDEGNGNGVVSENPHNIEIEKADESLIMLIEAAKMILGEFKDDDESEGSELKKDELAAEIAAIERKLRQRSKGSAPEMGREFEETTSSSVVRSKRGRLQVLPCKYRDSVLEPLTRLSKQRRRKLNCERK